MLEEETLCFSGFSRVLFHQLHGPAWIYELQKFKWWQCSLSWAAKTNGSIWQRVELIGKIWTKDFIKVNSDNTYTVEYILIIMMIKWVEWKLVNLQIKVWMKLGRKRRRTAIKGHVLQHRGYEERKDWFKGGRGKVTKYKWVCRSWKTYCRGGGEEAKRRRPCVLHLIRLRLRAINYTRERIYTPAGTQTVKRTHASFSLPPSLSVCRHRPTSHTHMDAVRAGYLSLGNELRLTDSSMSLTLILLRPAWHKTDSY